MNHKKLYLSILMILASTVHAKDEATSPNTSNVQTQNAQNIESVQSLPVESKKTYTSVSSAYKDKYMNFTDEVNDSIKTESAEGDAVSSYGFEARAGYMTQNDDQEGQRDSQIYGLKAYYNVKTINYGTTLVSGSVRYGLGDYDSLDFWSRASSSEPQGGTFLLENKNLPIGSGILVDTSIGDTTSSLTRAFSSRYRLSLGGSIIRGAKTKLRGRDFEFSAGAGQRGEMIGNPFVGFEATEGEMGWIGASYRLFEKGFIGAHVSHSTASYVYAPNGNINRVGDNTLQPYNLNRPTTNVSLSLGYGDDLVRNDDYRMRAVVIHSSVDFGGDMGTKNANGIFLDGGVQKDNVKYETGLFYTDPLLSFNDYMLSSGNQGVYLNASSQMTDTYLSGGVLYEQQRPFQYQGLGLTQDRMLLNAKWRHRVGLERDFGLSGNAWSTMNYELTTPQRVVTKDDSIRLNATAYYRDSFFDSVGRSSFYLRGYSNDVIVTNGSAATGWSVSVDQDWLKPRGENMNHELSTMLGYAIDESSGYQNTYPVFGAKGRYWFSSQWSASANILITPNDSELYSTQGFAGSISLDGQLGQGWGLGASLSFNENTVNPQTNPIEGQTYSRTQDTYGYAYLRWDASHGSISEPIGRAYEIGHGNVQGLVFLDMNQDGVYQSGEEVIQGVVVRLGGAESVTNDQGEFTFNRVYIGEQRLRLSEDDLPVRFSRKDDGMYVDVLLRDTIRVNIPVLLSQKEEDM